MVKIIATKELASKYKEVISIMRPLPQSNKVELYMGQPLYQKIKDNENPEEYEVVYDSNLR